MNLNIQMIKMMAKIYQTFLTHIQKSLNHSSLIKVTSIFWNNASIEEKTIYKKLFKRVHEIQKELYFQK
jgi:RNA-binding protein YhbY